MKASFKESSKIHFVQFNDLSLMACKISNPFFILKNRSNFGSGQNSLFESDQGSIKTQMFICQKPQQQQDSSNTAKLPENQGNQLQHKTNILMNINK